MSSIYSLAVDVGIDTSGTPLEQEQGLSPEMRAERRRNIAWYQRHAAELEPLLKGACVRDGPALIEVNALNGYF